MVNPIKVVAMAGRKIIRPAVKGLTKIKANRPEIYVCAGIAFILTSFGFVAYKSTKAPEIMEQTSGKVKDLRDQKKDLEEQENPTKIIVDPEGNQEIKILSPAEKVQELKALDKEIHKARNEGIWLMVKLYVVPIILLLIGLGFDLRGVRILRKENIALAATVGGLEKFINFYRENVIADQGKEKDLQYARGIIGSKDIEVLTKGKDGNEVKETKKVPIIRNPDGNPWRFEYSPTYFRSATGDVEYDIGHIKNVQDYFDRIYNTRKKHGKISYYEVLDYLDPIWEAIDADGSVETFTREYGWGHAENGDDSIDLGIYRGINDAAIRGIGDVVWIEGNCDGRLSTIKNKYKEKYLI